MTAKRPDANDVLCQRGANGLRAAFDTAERPKANGTRRLALTMLHELAPVGLQDRLVRGLLGEGILAMVYGEPSSGKSFAVFDLGMHIALGWPWLSRKVTAGGVLYVASEAAGGWSNRTEAFCRHHGLSDDARQRIPFAFVLASVNLGPDGADDVETIVQAATDLADRTGEPTRLIVIDTLARSMQGGDENSSVDMGAFVAKCDAIRRRTGATVLIVHHSGKNAAMGARGHSALRAAVDAEFEVERSSDHRTLRVRKSRDGADGVVIGFKLQVVEIGVDDDGSDSAGTPITSCVVLPAEVPAGQSDNPTKGQRLPQSLRAFMDAMRIGLHDHGRPITPFPPDGPTVRAVDEEHLRTAYYAMLADTVVPDSRRTMFKRRLQQAIDRQDVVTRTIDGKTLIWLGKKA